MVVNLYGYLLFKEVSFCESLIFVQIKFSGVLTALKSMCQLVTTCTKVEKFLL